MYIQDLSLVSKAIQKVIEEAVKKSTICSRTNFTVPVVPPDKIQKNYLGLYLYHICEDPAFKNQPPITSSDVTTPLRYNPMALNLYYLLTTDSQTDVSSEIFETQKLMGVAIKALHDYPVLTKNTVVNDLNIFETVGIHQDTKLRITMQPTPCNEAVNYWTAGQSPLRLSAYYNVSVVFLEPEIPPGLSGRVLDLGLQTFTSGSPRLVSSKNILKLKIPDNEDLREIELRPAEVPMGERFELLGANLKGNETYMVLNNSEWNNGVTADMHWGVISTNEKIIATTQNQIDGTDIIPGIYTAKAMLKENRTMPDGSTRTITNISNETPFTITPRIDNENRIVTQETDGTFIVKGFRFQHYDIKPEDVEVYIGINRLKWREPGTSLKPGEYDIEDENKLTFRLPTGTASGFMPFRLIIKGAASAPAWVEVP